VRSSNACARSWQRETRALARKRWTSRRPRPCAPIDSCMDGMLAAGLLRSALGDGRGRTHEGTCGPATRSPGKRSRLRDANQVVQRRRSGITDDNCCRWSLDWIRGETKPFCCQGDSADRFSQTNASDRRRTSHSVIHGTFQDSAKGRPQQLLRDRPRGCPTDNAHQLSDFCFLIHTTQLLHAVLRSGRASVPHLT